MEYLDKIKESSSFIKEKFNEKLDLAIVLGSGLGDMAEKIENPIYINYKDIPNFPVSTVKGHKGRLVLGNLMGKNIVAMQGRFHYYEGYDIKDVVFPIRVLLDLKIKNLIVTNAAGGANKIFEPGDLMIIEDHINNSGINPLRGLNLDEKGPRFPDMTNAYSIRLKKLAKEAAVNLAIPVKEGVYMWMQGPTYETPAEVRMAFAMGADAVGMSTVPEVIVARHEGVEVLGISCITNMAAGILDEELNHDDVVKTSLRVKDDFERLILEIIKNI